MLHNKVALITGGGSGMGAATAHLLASAGASVVVGDIDAPSDQRVVSEIKQTGAQAHFVAVDVAHPTDVAAMVEQTVSTFGRLDVAVNNAALTPDRQPLVDLDVQQWDQIMASNLKGVALCLKYELQQMVQ